MMWKISISIDLTGDEGDLLCRVAGEVMWKYSHIIKSLAHQGLGCCMAWRIG
jgi:hypothetical protein